MYIDGKPLENYGAKLLDFTPGFPSLSNTVTEGKNYALPRLLRSEITPKPLETTLTIRGKDYPAAMQAASRLIVRLNKTAELYMPDGFYYRSALTGATDFEWLSIGLLQFKLTFQSVQHGPLQSVTIPRNNCPLHYLGTAPAGYRIEFAPTGVMQSFTVNGITIFNIPAGAKIVIDGIEKTVTQNGVNKFAETNLIDFPRFDPQNPDVTVIMSQYFPVKISYYPTYM